MRAPEHRLLIGKFPSRTLRRLKSIVPSSLLSNLGSTKNWVSYPDFNLESVFCVSWGAAGGDVVVAFVSSSTFLRYTCR